MSDQDAIDIAEEAISKKKYNPFERAKDRGYPYKEVTIYWDEVGARKLVEHQKELDKLQAKVAYGIELLKRADEQMKNLGDANNKKAMTELQKAKDEATKELQRFQADFDAKEAEGLKLAEELESTGVTFGLRGFSPEADDAMQEKVNAAVPVGETGERTPDQVAEWSRLYNAEVISGAIEWHQPHGEDKRTQKIDPEVILEWRRDLPEESYLKLIQAVSDVAKGKEYFLALVSRE